MIFILIFLIGVFRIPSEIWRIIVYLNGFDLSHVNSIIMSKIYFNEYKKVGNVVNTQETVEAICDQIRMTFLKQKYIKRKKTDMFQMKTKITFPLFFPYILVKLLYLVILAFTFFFLSKVFQFNYFNYGIYMLKKNNGTQFSIGNDYFPKNALCKTQLLSVHEHLNHIFLCALPLNLYHEFFFLFFWYWMIFLAMSTIISIFYWLLLCFGQYRRRLVKKALQISTNPNMARSYTVAYLYMDEANDDCFNKIDDYLIEKNGLGLLQNFEVYIFTLYNI